MNPQSRAFYMLIGAAALATPPGDGECPPYTKPAPNAAHATLSEPLIRADRAAAGVTLCERFTN